MTSFRKLTVAIFLVTCGLFCATPAKADGLVFSNVRLQLLGTTPPGGIDLFANQGIVLTSPISSATISIFVSGPLPAGGDILRLTVIATNENGTFVITNPNPASLNIPITISNVNTTQVTGFDIPPSFQGTTFTLTVDLLNSSPDFIIPSGPNAGQAVNSFTFTFTVVEPVPEPATLVLLTTGIAGIGVKRYRRYRASRT
jgi:hypothetical protein